jgi:hypothetical protein
MTASHKHFEFLCLLAASEELTEGETVALRDHARACVSCRARILETTQLTSHLLLARAFRRKNGQLSADMRERFAERAIAEGVPLPRPSAASVGRLGLAGVLLATLLIVAVAVNHAGPARSTAGTASLQAAPVAAAVNASPFFPDCGREKAKKISFLRHNQVRPARLSFPIYQGVFQNRTFSAPLNLSPESQLRSRFPAPRVLEKNDTLNLMANFQPGISSPGARTFEYSGGSIPRFIQICGCESR